MSIQRCCRAAFLRCEKTEVSKTRLTHAVGVRKGGHPEALSGLPRITHSPRWSSHVLGSSAGRPPPERELSSRCIPIEWHSHVAQSAMAIQPQHFRIRDGELGSVPGGVHQTFAATKWLMVSCPRAALDFRSGGRAPAVALDFCPIIKQPS